MYAHETYCICLRFSLRLGLVLLHQLACRCSVCKDCCPSLSTLLQVNRHPHIATAIFLPSCPCQVFFSWARSSLFDTHGHRHESFVIRITQSGRLTRLFTLQRLCWPQTEQRLTLSFGIELRISQSRLRCDLQFYLYWGMRLCETDMNDDSKRKSRRSRQSLLWLLLTSDYRYSLLRVC
jgi:hypothetical protein